MVVTVGGDCEEARISSKTRDSRCATEPGRILRENLTRISAAAGKDVGKKGDYFDKELEIYVSKKGYYSNEEERRVHFRDRRP